MLGSRRHASLFAVFLVAATIDARADERACGSGRPWIGLSFSGDFSESFRQGVLQDLRAGLSSRGIAVCRSVPDRATGALAVVQLSARSAANVGVSVEVRDAVTRKRVTRDLDLGNVPGDGRAFAVALAADELVQASWVELALERRREPSHAPSEVRTSVERALRASGALPVARIGARAAAERFAGGQLHFGADAALQVPVFDGLRLELAFGARQGRTAESTRGDVTSNVLGGGLALELLVVEEPDFEGWVEAGVRASHVRFAGHALEGAVASDFSGLAVYARGGPGAALHVLGPFWVTGGLWAGAPIRALEAHDGDRVATAVAGLELAAAAGLTLEL